MISNWRQTVNNPPSMILKWPRSQVKHKICVWTVSKWSIVRKTVRHKEYSEPISYQWKETVLTQPLGQKCPIPGKTFGLNPVGRWTAYLEVPAESTATSFWEDWSWDWARIMVLPSPNAQQTTWRLCMQARNRVLLTAPNAQETPSVQSPQCPKPQWPAK